MAGQTEAAAIRLNRLLASAGFGSRRQCDALIEEGRVEIDGEPVSKLGTTVEPETRQVSVDGVPLKRQRLVYFAVNKPTGVVTTNADPHGRPRVIDLVPPGQRVFPVGRLDMSSEGLILLTNDGSLAQQLAHPRFGIKKVYRVTVAGRLDTTKLRQMQKGIYLAEGLVRVEGAKILKSRERATELEIVLREGKNRELRRILARLGHKVQRLRRIAIGPLKLADLPPGAFRGLSREEVRKLREATESTRKEPTDRGGRSRPQPGAGKPRNAPRSSRRATSARDSNRSGGRTAKRSRKRSG